MSRKVAGGDGEAVRQGGGLRHQRHLPRRRLRDDAARELQGQADYLKAVAAAEGLIVRSDIVDAEVLEAAPALKIVVRAGAGYDNIDLKTAAARGSWP